MPARGDDGPGPVNAPVASLVHNPQGSLSAAFTLCARADQRESPLDAVALGNVGEARMLQRTLPAGLIAPCLPTKTDNCPQQRMAARD